jgi:hypothetical protein
MTEPDAERSERYEAVYRRYLRLSALLVEESRVARREARASRPSGSAPATDDGSDG